MDIDHLMDHAHLIDFSSDDFTWEEINKLDSNKRATLNNGNSATRRQQNRDAARRSRSRKKLQESKLQQSLSFYTKSNEAIKKHNQVLQDMLDLARYQVAKLAKGEMTQPVEIAGHHAYHSTLSQLDVPSNITISLFDDVQVAPVNSSVVPSSTQSSGLEVSNEIDDFIDVLLENDDWTAKNNEPQANEPSANEISDDGSDHIDFLLRNEFWADDEDATKGGGVTVPSSQVFTSMAQLRPVQVTSPMLSLHLASTSQKPKTKSITPGNTRLSRKEMNRIHARNRRMKVKMEHAQLKHSVDTYTKSNAALKKNNKELELMLLKAHSYVAGATRGYQHYSTVFADGAKCRNYAGCGKETNDKAVMHGRGGNDDRWESTLSRTDDDDDNHSLSFLWS